jgi:hypothetical protein
MTYGVEKMQPSLKLGRTFKNKHHKGEKGTLTLGERKG